MNLREEIVHWPCHMMNGDSITCDGVTLDALGCVKVTKYLFDAVAKGVNHTLLRRRGTMRSSNQRTLEDLLGAKRPWEWKEVARGPILKLPADARRGAGVVVSNLSFDPVEVHDGESFMVKIEFGEHAKLSFRRALSRRERLLLVCP